MRIGVPREYRVVACRPRSRRCGKGWGLAQERRRRDGRGVFAAHEVRTAAYYIVNPAEASSNLAPLRRRALRLTVPGRDVIDMYEKTRAAGFGKEVRRRVMIGTYVLSPATTMRITCARSRSER